MIVMRVDRDDPRRQRSPRRPHRRSTRSKVRADFPILSTERPRQAAGLPRQRRDDAEAAAGHRRDRPLLRDRRTPTSTAASTTSASSRPTRTRRRARKVAAVHQRAPTSARCIFTRGTTEGINLVAASLRAATFLKPGDEVVVSAMEHHSNIVPWQIACEMTGAKLRVIPINDRGELLLDEYAKLLAGGRVKLVSVVHLSNSLGTINDVKRIAAAGARARRAGADRRGAVGRALPDRRAGPRRRLLRLLRPQAVRPDRHRRAVGQARAARGDAAVPGRRGHDRVGHVREDDVRASCRTSSRPARRDIAGAVGLGGGDRLRARRSASTNVAPHEHELLAYATRAARAKCPACASSAPRRTRRA